MDGLQAVPAFILAVFMFIACCTTPSGSPASGAVTSLPTSEPTSLGTFAFRALVVVRFLRNNS